MNNGYICVSVCAKTAEELIEQTKRAEDLADVVEIRFDCLDESEFELALQKLDSYTRSKTFLATYRPKSKDAEFVFGKSVDDTDIDIKQFPEAARLRKKGWMKISCLKGMDFVDFETDIQIRFMLANLATGWAKKAAFAFSGEIDRLFKEKVIIISEHFFDGVPQNLADVYEEMKSSSDNGLDVDIIKIAAQTDDITNTIPIWNLLKRAKSENREIIPIAMSESGKWTRILGLAHGAFMTYASLDSGSETAPGQVSARDLIEVYRAKELNEETDVYGILGSNTSVSMSPYIHNAAFKFHKLNSVFVPLQVQNLDEFVTRMVKPETREIELNFKGFAVTIPHKQSIINHLDFVDETAKAIGAVNTVKIIDGKLHGFNTDAQGFIQPLKTHFGDLKDAKVAIFGAGGASKACVYELEKEGAKATVFGRKQIQEIANFKSQIANNDILVNATPLGMKGKAEGETPITTDQMKGVKLVYDLVYTPQETEFIKQAKSLNIQTLGGLKMLLAQAIEQQKIWTGLETPAEIIADAINRNP